MIINLIDRTTYMVLVMMVIQIQRKYIKMVTLDLTQPHDFKDKFTWVMLKVGNTYHHNTRIHSYKIYRTTSRDNTELL